MCNNESKEMRQTFPYLYNQINSLRAHRKAESRAAKRSSASSQTQTQSGSESYEELYVPNGRAYAPLNIYGEPRARSYPLPEGYLPRAQGFQYYDAGFKPRPLGFPLRLEGFQYGQREFRPSSFVREESRERRDDIKRSSSSPSSQERYTSSQSNSRERPKLSESFIMKNKMDFTKTNPIADDDSVETPSKLRQRSEYQAEVKVHNSADEYKVTAQFY